MNVKELIEKLGEYPQDMRVVVQGYESGYEDISPKLINTQGVKIGCGQNWWDGKHQPVGDAHYFDDKAESKPTENVLAIARPWRSA